MILHNRDDYHDGVSNEKNLGSLSFGVKIDDTVTDHSQGTLVSTDNNTDFAIIGNGFFQVSDDLNNTYYTRDGSFKVNPHAKVEYKEHGRPTTPVRKSTTIGKLKKFKF